MPSEEPNSTDSGWARVAASDALGEAEDGFGIDAEVDADEAENPFPRERIAALQSWCTAPAGSGCSRCVVACPHGAVSLEATGPVIDEAACTRCGLCAGVCDAFA